jgi:hypothetical protein
MRIRSYVLRVLAVLVLPCSAASALVIDSPVTWTERTAINGLAGGFVEIVEGGHLIANARVDLNGSGVPGAGRVILNGGLFESTVDFKHPDDNTGLPCVIEIKAGTFTANVIESFGIDRLATIEIGGGTLIVQSGYLADFSSQTAQEMRRNPAVWIDNGSMFAKSGYEMVVEDLGDGAVQIYGVLLTTPAHNPNPADGEEGVLVAGAHLSWSTGTDPSDANNPNPNIKEHYLWVSNPYDPMTTETMPPQWWNEPGVSPITIPADWDGVGEPVDPNITWPVPGLLPNSLYFWVVDESLGASGPTDWDNLILGNTWSFETETTGPEVDAGPSVVTWLKDGTTTVDLDGSIAGGVGNVTKMWTLVRSPNDVAVDIADASAVQTTVTLSETTEAGPYLLQLHAIDSSVPALEDADMMRIDVYNNNCEAAQESPTGYTAPPYDFNGDCIENFVDFALFAHRWLEDTSLSADLKHDPGEIALPHLEFTNPTGGIISGEIVINAVAYDPSVGAVDGAGMDDAGGPAGVFFEIFDNSAALVASHQEQGAAFNMTWNTAELDPITSERLYPEGSYTIRATATSVAGYVTVAEVTVTVSNP